MAEVQRMLDPHSTVEHNVKLVDVNGHKRQFDVVVRGTLGGHAIVGVLEVRDRRRPLGLEAVDGFATKSRSVNANFSILVSRFGFTKEALEKARFDGISAYSLLASDATAPGVHVFGRYYAVIWTWAKMTWTIVPAEGHALPSTYDPLLVYFGEQRVQEWVLGFLVANTPYCRSEGEGWYRIGIEFTNPIELLIAGQPYRVGWFYVDALLNRRRKVKDVEWLGNYFVDWHLSAVKVPPLGKLESSTKADFANWPDYAGPEPPAAQGPIDLHIEVLAVPTAVMEERDGARKLKWPTRHLSEVGKVHFAKHPES